MKSNSIKYLTLSAALAAAIHANAGVVYYTVGDASDMEWFDTSLDGQQGAVLAGGIQISQPDTFSQPNVSTMPQYYVSICLDYQGTLNLGQTYAYNSPASSLIGQQGLAPNWNNSALAIQNAAYLFYTYGNISDTGVNGSVQEMAALQLAVWMALYDTTASGNVVVNSQSAFTVLDGQDNGAIALANSWVAGLTGNYNYTEAVLTPVLNLGDQGNPDGQLPQELMMGTSPVPEPSTIVAGGLLLLPLGASLLRSVRKSKQD